MVGIDGVVVMVALAVTKVVMIVVPRSKPFVTTPGVWKGDSKSWGKHLASTAGLAPPPPGRGILSAGNT